jgi:hypothetical protein
MIAEEVNENLILRGYDQVGKKTWENKRVMFGRVATKIVKAGFYFLV